MKLRNLVLSTTLFTAGVLASNRVRHAIASMRSNESIPYVRVQYTKDAALVNDERVYTNRIGAVRCDWDSITAENRQHYALSEFQHNPLVLPSYLRNAPAVDVEHLTYASLVQMARRSGTSIATQVDSMRASLGYRWSMDWSQSRENAR